MDRLPRFKRADAAAPIHLTARDLQIIRLVHRHRFLRSPHITALADGSSQQILRRLQLLYHHGYLERPRAQIDYYHKGGSRYIVYGLGTKAATVLQPGISSPNLREGEKNGNAGRTFLEHTLFVSEIMVKIELACREHGIRLLTQEELNAKPFRWNVNVNGRKLGIVPDRAFALEYADESGNIERAFFFLEADRGTMPVIRDTLSQTSFYRKLLAYQATWAQSIHRERFGFHRFRVLTVTVSNARIESMLEACSRLETGHGLFLFSEQGIMNHDSLLSSIWRNGRHEMCSLLDE